MKAAELAAAKEAAEEQTKEGFIKCIAAMIKDLEEAKAEALKQVVEAQAARKVAEKDHADVKGQMTSIMEEAEQPKWHECLDKVEAKH